MPYVRYGESLLSMRETVYSLTDIFLICLRDHFTMVSLPENTDVNEACDKLYKCHRIERVELIHHSGFPQQRQKYQRTSQYDSLVPKHHSLHLGLTSTTLLGMSDYLSLFLPTRRLPTSTIKTWRPREKNQIRLH